jgi:hypothetical protein
MFDQVCWLLRGAKSTLNKYEIHFKVSGWYPVVGGSLLYKAVFAKIAPFKHLINPKTVLNMNC